MDHVASLRENGFAVVRNFLPPEDVDAMVAALDRVKVEAMKHHTSYRDRNLLFEVHEDPQLNERVCIQAHWTCWIDETMERMRRHPRYLEILEPLLGRDIKHYANQIHWKPPGAKYTYYRYHQDIKFRTRPELFGNLDTGWVTTGLALNRQGGDNGALCVYPGSHRMGYLGMGDGDTVMTGGSNDEELRAAGLDPRGMLQLELEPGDLVLWTLHTLHGSQPNTSDRDRLFVLNSYVRAADSPVRGEWTFRNGESVPLGDTPQICKYDELQENPGPFYIDDNWTEESLASRIASSAQQ